MTGPQSTLALSKGEFQKIWAQRKFKVFLIIFALVIIGGALLGVIPGSVIKLTMGNYPYTALSVMTYVFAPIAIFTSAADFFSGEFDSGQIKVALTRPIARYKVLFAKVLAIAGFVGVVFLNTLVLSVVLGVVFSGVSSLSFAMVLAYIVGYIPMLAVIGLAVLIATLARAGTSCFSLCVFVYIAFHVAGVLFSAVSPALFTTYLGMGSMVIGSSVPVSGLLSGIAVSLGYAAVCLSAGVLRFSNKEF
ncbi:MAG: ABC transporter permease [Clostridiales bacterium]|nr:ABC transporter permease [Clostridiales bacterium]